MGVPWLAPLAILLLLVAVSILTARMIDSRRGTGTAAPATIEPAPSTPLPSQLPLHSDTASAAAENDSLTLLLLARHRLHAVTVSSRGPLRIDGRRVAGGEIELVLDGQGRIVAGGAAASHRAIRAENGEPLRIASDAGDRVVHGGVTVTAAEDRIEIAARIGRRDYLAAVLAGETMPNDPLEYGVAVAVVQRNYADAHRGRHAPLADLCDNTHCQVASISGGTSRTYRMVDRAASITLRHGNALPCYYSANCGGSTLTPGEIWRRQEPGYSNVRCGDCRGGKHHRWQRTLPANAVTTRLIGHAPPAPFIDDDFKIGVGREVGFNVVLSNTVDRIERRGDRFVIEGRGFGHRGGLCQDGARELARHGRTAEAILARYFPAARVTNTGS